MSAVVHPVVVLETLRRQVTSIGYWTYVAFVVMVALFVSRFHQPATGWPSLIALLAIVIGCTPIGPEFSSGTLQLILVKPVKRWVYLLSRVLGVLCAVGIAAILAGSCELIGRLLWSNVTASERIGVAVVNCMADAALAASLLALLGSLTRAYFNVAIYVVVLVAFNVTQAVMGIMRVSESALGRFLASHPEIELAVARIELSLFPEFPPRFDSQWLLLLLTESAVALILACLVFRRREVPYGAD